MFGNQLVSTCKEDELQVIIGSLIMSLIREMTAMQIKFQLRNLVDLALLSNWFLLVFTLFPCQTRSSMNQTNFNQLNQLLNQVFRYSLDQRLPVQTV